MNSDLSWPEFRSRLKPKYWLVAADIALCYIMIFIAIIALCFLTHKLGNTVVFIVSPIASFFIGFWLHALNCFGHEAVHYNLAKNKKWNDYLGNLLIWSWFGEHIKNYRYIHWQHHQHLGTDQDTETSYRNHPSFRFILRTLFGIHAISTINKRQGNQSQPGRNMQTKRRIFSIATTIFLHSMIISLFIINQYYATAFIWAASIGMVYPFLNTIRQILEHRNPSDSHATNRIFKSTLLSRFFGSAGFNKHFLHHWDPQISYTRFVDMEKFLSQTDLKNELLNAKTSYRKTFKILRENREK
jgi:fatty acid desaturase